jgi:hypothetical protein
LSQKDVDTGKVVGWVEIIVRDKNGNIKYESVSSKDEILALKKQGNPHPTSLPAKLLDLHYWRKNVITNVGLACIIRLIFYGLSEDKFRYLAIGTGLTAEEVDDTSLEVEIKRKSATITQVTTLITDDTGLCEATFSSADGLSGTSNVSETGILNDPSAGDLLARKVFSAVPINWDIGDTLTIRYYVQMAR